MTRTYPLFSLLWLLAGPALAQSLSKQADRQFNQLAYAKAADLYEQALTRKPTLSEGDRRAALARLGYSYQQMRDMTNAERVYHDLLAGSDITDDYAEYYLYYAQSLASNGKYREAQQAYAKYDKMQPASQRGPTLSTLTRNVGTLASSTDNYKVDFLKLNTRRAEFNPVRYKSGMAFVPDGTAKGVKRMLGNGYLNLYYLPDPKAANGSKARLQLLQTPERGQTASTANDSRRVGFFGGGTINAGQGYSLETVRASARSGRASNVDNADGPVTFSADGSQVIFTRSGNKDRQNSTSTNKLKLYTARQSDSFWGPVEELPFNSDAFSTGHPALSPDDRRLYFASDRPGGFGGTDIYVSEWTGSTWSTPVNLGKEINSKGNELFPFVDGRGNLYVSSNGHGGLGELDLFYAQLSSDGRQVESLKNLGEPLNSPKDDFGIVTDAKRRSGYFSSNRKNGTTDEVFRFNREGSLYPCRQMTVSLFDADTRKPLANASITVDGNGAGKTKQQKTNAQGLMQLCLDADSEIELLASRDGYVATKVGFSTRYISDDEPSLLEIPLSKPASPSNATLLGYVTAQGTRQPIAGAKVMLINECDGSSEQTLTDLDGCYEFTVQTGCEYALEAMKANMGTTGTHIARDGSGSPDMVMFKKGDVMTIENIYYDVNKTTIRPDAAAELDKVVDLMNKYPSMQIEMRSHTDSRATSTYNTNLSGNRAKAAVAYLKSKGISPKRMMAKGYGESQLLNKCKDGVDCTDDEHQQNRRTEIKILKLG